MKKYRENPQTFIINSHVVLLEVDGDSSITQICNAEDKGKEETPGISNPAKTWFNNDIESCKKTFFNNDIE